MSEREKQLRECIIPDITVKFKDLCLNDNENGIIANFQYNRHKEHFQTLESLISKYKNNLPITIRKLLLYKQYQYG